VDWERSNPITPKRNKKKTEAVVREPVLGAPLPQGYRRMRLTELLKIWDQAHNGFRSIVELTRLALNLLVSGQEPLLCGIDVAAPFSIERPFVEAGSCQEPLQEQDIPASHSLCHLLTTLVPPTPTRQPTWAQRVQFECSFSTPVDMESEGSRSKSQILRDRHGLAEQHRRLHNPN
jgi:hypothetical protein